MAKKEIESFQMGDDVYFGTEFLGRFICYTYSGPRKEVMVEVLKNSEKDRELKHEDWYAKDVSKFPRKLSPEAFRKKSLKDVSACMLSAAVILGSILFAVSFAYVLFCDFTTLWGTILRGLFGALIMCGFLSSLFRASANKLNRK